MAEQINNETNNNTETEPVNTNQNTDQQGNQVDVEQVKKEAVDNLLKEYGVADSETLRDIVNKHNEEIESNKTDLQKKDDTIGTLTKELAQERSARILAEAKLSAVKLGAKTGLVDDLALLAQAKVTKDKDINQVIAELKDSETGKLYFVNEEETGKPGAVTRVDVSSNRTGTNNKNNNGNEENTKHTGTMAERLLGKRKKATNFYYK